MSRFVNQDLAGALFRDCDMQRAKFNDVDLHNCSFSNVDLSAASFIDCDWTDTVIEGVPVAKMLEVYKQHGPR